MSEPQDVDNPLALPSVQPVNPMVEGSASEVPMWIESVEPVYEVRPDPFMVWLKGGHPLFAWLVIFVLVLGVPALRSLRAPEDAASHENRLQLLVLNLQAKFLVGFHELLANSQQANDVSMVQQAEALNAGSVDQRLCYVALVGELGGFRAAQDKLAALSGKLAGSDHVLLARDLMAKETLDRLYTSYRAGIFDDPKIDEEQKQNLRETLGWLGELALAPPGGNNPEIRKALLSSARSLFIVFMLIFVLGAILAVAGAIGLMVLLLYMFTGQRRQGVAIVLFTVEIDQIAKQTFTDAVDGQQRGTRFRITALRALGLAASSAGVALTALPTSLIRAGGRSAARIGTPLGGCRGVD